MLACCASSHSSQVNIYLYLACTLDVHWFDLVFDLEIAIEFARYSAKVHTLQSKIRTELLILHRFASAKAVLQDVRVNITIYEV